MTGRDALYIKRLIDCITDHVDYGDIVELCDILKVDIDWFEQFYEWDEE